MTWHTAVIALLTFGATLRVTRLLAQDTITRALRDKAAALSDKAATAAAEAKKRLKAAQKLGDEAGVKKAAADALKATRRHQRYALAVEGLNCQWCLSIYVAAAAVVGFTRYVADVWPHDYSDGQWFVVVTAALTLSFLTGLVAERTGTDEAPAGAEK